MNDPFADTHSKEDGKHPAAELNEREGASWPSEKKEISIVTFLKSLLNGTTKKEFIHAGVGQGKRVNLYSQSNPSQLIIRLRTIPEILEGSRNSQPCDEYLAHVNSKLRCHNIHG